MRNIFVPKGFEGFRMTQREANIYSRNFFTASALNMVTVHTIRSFGHRVTNSPFVKERFLYKSHFYKLFQVAINRYEIKSFLVPFFFHGTVNVFYRHRLLLRAQKLEDLDSFRRRFQTHLTEFFFEFHGPCLTMKNY